nr:CLIP-associating protein 1-A-like [Procambarus clarkii]
MTFLVERMKEDFRPYLSSVIPAVTDRLGKSLLSLSVVSGISKALLLLLDLPYMIIINHGASSVTVSRLIPHIVKLLSDPTAMVRDCAFNTLVECYKHYGERLRADLTKKHNIPPAKLPGLMTRFDDIRDTGLMLPTATTATGTIEG